MKLLIILKVNFPYPLKTGGQQAVFNMIDRLRDKINISLLYDRHIVSDSDEKTLKREWNNVNFFPFDKPYSKQIHWDLSYFCWVIYKVLIKIFSRNKVVDKNATLSSMEDVYSSDFLDFISNVIATEKIDIVQTEFNNTLKLVYALPDNVKKIFVQHEIRYIRNCLFMSNLKKSNSLDLYKVNKVKYEEITAMNKYDVVVTLTEVDKYKLLAEGINTEIVASPACIPAKSIVTEYYSANNRLTFLGSSKHTANVRGLNWFLEEVWSKIMKNNDKIKLTIIGDWSNKEKTEIQKKYPNVRFFGFVENLEEALSGTIMIVPIREGSGMRMKILDAINNGCTFITTSIGVEGLDFIDGQDCLIADDAEKFAKNVLILDGDKDLQKRLFFQSKKTYEKKYSVNVSIKKRFEIYQNLIK